MEYLLDTNTCIYIIKKNPPEVLEKFKTLSLGMVGISSITLAELQYGVMKSANPRKNRLALERFAIPLDILDFGYLQTIEYGKLRADLEGKGKPIGPMDMMIAAHALSLGAILVTNNEREFQRVTGLKIENWVI